MNERRIIDRESPEEQFAAADLALTDAMTADPSLKGASLRRDEDGYIFAVLGERREPLGHISTCLDRLQELNDLRSESR